MGKGTIEETGTPFNNKTWNANSHMPREPFSPAPLFSGGLVGPWNKKKADMGINF